MNTTLFISLRYLFSKKSHNAINWVSAISVAGVALTTAAMICILSVFNGFRGLLEQLFTVFDPELRIELVQGKSVPADDPVLQAVKSSGKVEIYTEVIEEQALIKWGDSQTLVTIKGVDDNFTSLADFSGTLIGRGELLLHAHDLHYAICGIGVARELNLPLVFSPPLQVFAPKPGERVNMANPVTSFRHEELHAPGIVFSVRQAKYDDRIVITSIAFARRLFSLEGRVSHIELKLATGATKADIEKLLDPRFRVLDRYQQQADSFRIMKIEKLMAFLFLSFILLIAAFNIVGSLSMLIIEKSADAQTLRALGASDKRIRSIFATEGRLIGLLGAVIGLALGLLLCWLQITFGFITLGGSEGSYIVDAYPVQVAPLDVLLVFLTVVLVSCLTVLWPVRHIK